MFAFENKNGSINLTCKGKTVLCGIAPWMNTRAHPWESNTYKDKIYPALKDCDSDSVCFEDETGAVKLTVSLKEKKNCFALCMSGEYDGSKLVGHGTHLCEYDGVGFDFDIEHDGAFVDAFMRCYFWQAARVTDKSSEVKPRTQGLIFKQGKKRVYCMSVCDKDYKTDIHPCGDKMLLSAHSNTILDSIDECVLIGSCGDDEYILPEQAVAYGLKIMKKPGKLRAQKKYPEIFEYLGWCSWDAFHMQVTDRNLYDKCQEFKDKDIPVRWMIMDDMWGNVTANDIPTMHRRELNSWEADPVRFPDGLKDTIEKIKSEYGLKVGIWHPTSGYWYGINPNSELAKKYASLLEYMIPEVNAGSPRLLHSFEAKKIDKYYDIQHKFYKSCGADFVKVDNQGGNEHFAMFKGSVGKCIGNLHHAIERSVDRNFDGALINCMGMPIENFWNRGKSTVNRFSGDFQPENRKWFIQHLLQCSYNSITQGTVYTGDWDMWWSDDAQALKNSVLRSMSGGPIYVSDTLNRSIRDVIMPCVLSDGRILRFSTPARPTRDCLFEDSEHNGKIYKVFNREGSFGVVAAFNLDEEEKCVKGTVSPSDVIGLKKGKYCVYDWLSKTASVLSYDDTISLELKNYDDFKLLIIVPIESGRAVIGLTEKYMSPLAIEQDKDEITALESGTLTVYSEKPLSGFSSCGNGLYTKAVTRGETVAK